MTIAADDRRQAFGQWLRTGHWPLPPESDAIEHKFNPWHDPADGRFTFAGSGTRSGTGGSGSGRSGGPRTPRAIPGSASRAARPDPAADRTTARTTEAPTRAGDPPNRAAEFAGGVGEGLSGVAAGAIRGTYATLTTNPVTTVRATGRRIAGTIDTVLTSEATPARIQLARAADAVANASARDVGRATGSLVGNAALVVAPAAATTKVAAVRGLREANLRPTYPPPQIGWAKERLPPKKPSTVYNDSAAGARPGQAPTLMRTMPDGSKRPVKFDGIQGDYVIDRKMSVYTTLRARDQVMRQSQALTENRLIATWEVPTVKQKRIAEKLLKRMNARNIRVRIVEP